MSELETPESSSNSNPGEAREKFGYDKYIMNEDSFSSEEEFIS